MKQVTAAFAEPSHAEQAVRALVESGVPRDRIEVRPSVLEDQVGPPVATVTGAHRVALICAIVAAVVAGVLAMLMTVGTIPAAGFEFLGTSTVGAGVRGLIAGGAAGALFGYILGMGMWDTDGEPEKLVSAHETLVSVPSLDQSAAVREALKKAGGRMV